MSDYKEQELCRTARLKTMLLQEHLSKKVLIDPNILSSLQNELQANKKLIEKLSHEKEDLKAALAKSIKKRDDLYQKLKTFKEQKKISSEFSISAINQKYESSSVHLQVQLRDAKILELHNEIEQLEGHLMKREAEIESWKELYSASNYIKNESALNRCPDYYGDILVIGEKFMSILKKNSVIYKTFKQIGNCEKYFLALLQKRVWDEALIKLLSFCEVLLASFKIESCLMRTPSFSPHQKIHINCEDNEDSCRHISILNPESSIKDTSSQGKSILKKSKSLNKPRVARMNKEKSRIN